AMPLPWHTSTALKSLLLRDPSLRLEFLQTPLEKGHESRGVKIVRLRCQHVALCIHYDIKRAGILAYKLVLELAIVFSHVGGYIGRLDRFEWNIVGVYANSDKLAHLGDDFRPGHNAIFHVSAVGAIDAREVD